MTYATQAELGYGTLLKFETVAGSGTFVEVEELKDVPEFGDDFELIEATHQSSPDRRKEYVAGLADASEQTFQHNWIKSATQEAVRAAQGTTRNFQLVFSSTPTLTITFPAVILSAKITAPVASLKMLVIRLKPTGDFTEA